MRLWVGVKGRVVQGAAPHPQLTVSALSLPAQLSILWYDLLFPFFCLLHFSFFNPLSASLPPSLHLSCIRCGVKNTGQMTNTAGFCLLLLLVFLATFSTDLTRRDWTCMLKVRYPPTQWPEKFPLTSDMPHSLCHNAFALFNPINYFLVVPCIGCNQGGRGTRAALENLRSSCIPLPTEMQTDDITGWSTQCWAELSHAEWVPRGLPNRWR